MTPAQLRELVEEVRRGEPIGLTRAIEIMQGYAAALEEIERLNAAWKAQQFHLEAEERNAAIQHELPEPRRSVEGAVMRVEQDSVLCELMSGARHITVRLPLALFSFDLTLGTPITLAIEEMNGLKLPVVTKRVVQRAEPDELDRQFEALLAEDQRLKVHAEAMAARIEWYAEEGWVNGDIPEARAYRAEFKDGEK